MPIVIGAVLFGSFALISFVVAKEPQKQSKRITGKRRSASRTK
jgi:hypothetical protein